MALRRAGMLLTIAVALAACTDESVIEVERPFFEDPPALAAGFLGYDEEAAELTVCGNCHIGQQSEWEETAHADAWATLQDAGGQEFCEACHTVNQNGNQTDQPGGWTATGDPRYHDVQCESCHGPGETHLANPDATQPLAMVAVGVDLTSGCGECHSGAHQPFVEEWEQSLHAQVVTHAADRAECQACHRGQGILEAWGVDAEYVEKDSPDHLPIVCAVCHDPHDAAHPGQLRFPVENVAVEEHLCARCHNRRTSPDPNSTRLEPHAPEADLLQGVAGWFPPGAEFNPGEIRGTHGSEGNPRLCATCHVNRFLVTDQITGEFVFQSTGHLFTAIPCVDEQGIPTTGDCPLTVADRSFDACTGCHGDEQAAFSALTRATERISALADELHALLEQVDPNLDGPGGEIGGDPTFTVAEGAFFNHGLATFGGSVTPASVHNPFLIEALLVASIEAVEQRYQVQSSFRGVGLRGSLAPILRETGR